MLIKFKNITVLTIYLSFGESDYQKQLKKWKRKINRIKRELENMKILVAPMEIKKK